jgi:flagellar biosynthesis anti-sigma factor FlgM
MNKLEPSIKIDRQKPVNGSVKGGVKGLVGKLPKPKNTDRVTLSESSRTQASAKGEKDIASEIRQDLVNKFRDVLKNGSYEVKSGEIADKIVQKIRENKNHLVL